MITLTSADSGMLVVLACFSSHVAVGPSHASRSHRRARSTPTGPLHPVASSAETRAIVQASPSSSVATNMVGSADSTLCISLGFLAGRERQSVDRCTVHESSGCWRSALARLLFRIQSCDEVPFNVLCDDCTCRCAFRTGAFFFLAILHNQSYQSRTQPCIMCDTLGRSCSHAHTGQRGLRTSSRVIPATLCTYSPSNQLLCEKKTWDMVMDASWKGSHVCASQLGLSQVVRSRVGPGVQTG